MKILLNILSVPAFAILMISLIASGKQAKKENIPFLEAYSGFWKMVINRLKK